MPTVPVDRPTPVRPTKIRSTVTARIMMTGRARFISSSSSYVVPFPLVQRNMGLDDSSHALACWEQEHKEHRQYTYSDRKRAPEQTHPSRRNRVGFDTVRRGNVVLRPRRDFSIVEGFGLAPSHERQKRLVVRVMDKNVFQSVPVGMLKHGAQRSHSGRSVKLCVG